MCKVANLFWVASLDRMTVHYIPNQFVHNVDIHEFIFKKLLLTTLAWVATLDIMRVWFEIPYSDQGTQGKVPSCRPLIEGQCQKASLDRGTSLDREASPDWVKVPYWWWSKLFSHCFFKPKVGVKARGYSPKTWYWDVPLDRVPFLGL